jgi:hypothetical protein
MSMDILVIGDNHNLSNIVFSLCMLQVLGQGTRHSNVTASLLL